MLAKFAAVPIREKVDLISLPCLHKAKNQIHVLVVNKYSISLWEPQQIYHIIQIKDPNEIALFRSHFLKGFNLIAMIRLVFSGRLLRSMIVFRSDMPMFTSKMHRLETFHPESEISYHVCGRNMQI